MHASAAPFYERQAVVRLLRQHRALVRGIRVKKTWAATYPSCEEPCFSTSKVENAELDRLEKHEEHTAVPVHTVTAIFPVSKWCVLLLHVVPTVPKSALTEMFAVST